MKLPCAALIAFGLALAAAGIWLQLAAIDSRIEAHAERAAAERPKFYAGAEFWNHDRTQGYRLLVDARADDTVRAAMFVALGNAPKPEQGGPMPPWMASCVRYGCDAICVCVFPVEASR